MSSYSNSATLELPKSLSRLHPTFNVSLFRPYAERDPSLGLSAHPHPLPVYLDATGQYYLIERIVAETRRGTELIYVLKWVGYHWQHSQNTKATHTFLEQEPGGRTAIKAWQSRLAAIPTPAVKDLTEKHLYSGPRAPAPSLIHVPAPLPLHAPPVPAPPPAPVAPPAAPPPVAPPAPPPRPRSSPPPAPSSGSSFLPVVPPPVSALSGRVSKPNCR
eukprot:731150-Rhodomonas_salina.1